MNPKKNVPIEETSNKKNNLKKNYDWMKSGNLPNNLPTGEGVGKKANQTQGTH